MYLNLGLTWVYIGVNSKNCEHFHKSKYSVQKSTEGLSQKYSVLTRVIKVTQKGVSLAAFQHQVSTTEFLLRKIKISLKSQSAAKWANSRNLIWPRRERHRLGIHFNWLRIKIRVKCILFIV